MTYHRPENMYGTLTEPTTFTIQRWLPGPVERIWRYLVDSDMRKQWLAAGAIPDAAGKRFELVWKNDTLSLPDDPRPEGFGAEQKMETELVSIVPMEELTIAWGAGTVTFELAPKGDRVLLSITHTGLKDAASQAMIGAGWHAHLDILVALTEGREPSSFWSDWRSLNAAYKTRLS